MHNNPIYWGGGGGGGGGGARLEELHAPFTTRSTTIIDNREPAFTILMLGTCICLNVNE